MMLSLIRTLVLFAILAASAGVSYAQTPSLNEALGIDVSPAVPGPGELVTITVSSFSFDIDRSTVMWTVNGKEVKGGVGERAVSFTVGAASTVARVDLAIITPSGDRVERSLTFPISGIDVIVEADTYVPPFYRGRALPTSGAATRLVAIPAGPSGNLLFRWEDDFEFVQGASGVGRQVMSARLNEFSDSRTYAVEVSSGDGGTKARREVVIEYAEPQIVFYEENPLKGVLYERSIPTQASLEGKEITVVAEPYFFSSLGRESAALMYEWTFNNEPAEADGAALTLRQDVEGEGSADINLSIQNVNRLLQTASAAFTLLYGQREP